MVDWVEHIMRSRIRIMLVSLLRGCIALFVFISANHCFLEEGVSAPKVPQSHFNAFSGLDYHFGASFPHQHSAEHDSDDSEAHSHGDAMSLQSESTGIKLKKIDARVVPPFLLPTVSLIIPEDEAQFFDNSAWTALRASLGDFSLSLASLSIASQAPPRVVID